MLRSMWIGQAKLVKRIFHPLREVRFPTILHPLSGTGHANSPEAYGEYPCVSTASRYRWLAQKTKETPGIFTIRLGTGCQCQHPLISSKS